MVKKLIFASKEGEFPRLKAHAPAACCGLVLLRRSHSRLFGHFSRTYGSDADQNPVTCSTQMAYVMNRCMSFMQSRERPTNLPVARFFGICCQARLRLFSSQQPFD